MAPKFLIIITAIILSILLTVLSVSIFFYLYQGSHLACTLEAKLCPDGSYVSRTGPNCEFAACPGEDEEGQVCIQVITPAQNPTTGECREFPTPCDVPAGWQKVDSCETSQVDTSNWQTYQNEEYGFEFKYPSQYLESNLSLSASAEVSKDYKGDVVIASIATKNSGPNLKKGDFTFNMVKINNFEGLDLRRWFNKNILPGLSAEERKNYSYDNLAGRSAIKVKFTHWEGEYREDIYVIDNGNLFQLNSGAVSEDKQSMIETFNQILSTFKFIE